MINFLVTIIIVLLFSCSYNTTAEPDCYEDYSEQDSVLSFSNDTITEIDSFELVIIYDESNKLNLSEEPEPFINEQDTIRRRGIFKKRIEPMIVDTSKQMKRDLIYEELEKTENLLIDQQKKIDSLIIKRK